MKPAGKRKPELSEYFQVGQYLDVYCQNSKMHKLARIVNIKDKEIEINYDGTSRKQNEVNPQNFIVENHVCTSILFLYNTFQYFQKGYTGDDYRNCHTSRDYLIYDHETCIQLTKELKELIKNQFEGLSAYEIVYIVRVKQFLHLDMILSLQFSQDEIPTTLEYIQTFLKFIKFYFEIFPSYFGDVEISFKQFLSLQST